MNLKTIKSNLSILIPGLCLFFSTHAYSNPVNDVDKDGLPDTVEVTRTANFTLTTQRELIPANGGTSTLVVDLSTHGVTIGSTVNVNTILARGDINADYSNEFFTLVFINADGNGNDQTFTQLSTPLNNGTEDLIFRNLTTPVNTQITVIDIGGSTPGFRVQGTTGSGVGTYTSNSTQVNGVDYYFNISGMGVISTSSLDTDSDGISNDYDLDSDGDTIPDIVEAGLIDTDGNYVVDNPITGPGSVSNPPDSDADGIPDFLDLESNNSSNNGTTYDISLTAYASLDTNADGMISSSDSNGGSDQNGNGIDDLIDDTDKDGTANIYDADDDNDGVADVSDAFPYDPSEQVDSDGDGTGDNGDAFPSNPGESADIDRDGIGDNSDNDVDNDGIPNALETPSASFSLTTQSFQVPGDGGNATQLIDLSAYNVQIGQEVTLSNLRADGDLNSSSETFAFNINAGEYLSNPLQTGQQCVGSLQAVTSSVKPTIKVIDIGSGTPGISILATTTTAVDPLSACNSIALQYQVTLSGQTVGEDDLDYDGVLNYSDFDSDNDTIPDVIEIGLTDNDFNWMVDNPSLAGSITQLPDSDNDGIPDYLDLESNNPLNNGTMYDIDNAGHATLDTNNDGVLNILDTNGAIDFDSDGVPD